MNDIAKKITVGLVDDHALFRAGIMSLLVSEPTVELIFEAGSGKHLFQQLNISVPDVILLDLDMEDMNGIEATQKLVEDYPEIKIIILTMHEEERMISYLMEIGAHGYLLKDTEQAELMTAIQRVYEQGFYFNTKIATAMLKGLKNKTAAPPQLGNEFGLTNRELDVLQAIAEELTTTEIAEKLSLSERTIEGYRKNILSKVGAKNAAGLIIKAIRSGLISV